MSQTKTKPLIDLDFYLKQVYPVVIYEEDEGFTAEIKELPGCITQGESLDEVMDLINDAKKLIIETAYEHNDHIPLPSTQTQFSGKLSLRMPHSLHQKLAEKATMEGISLNQYICSLLSEENAVRNSIEKTLGFILENTQIMKSYISGIKNNQSIAIEGDISHIPDGSEVKIEISTLDKQIDTSSISIIDSISGKWKSNPEIEKISAQEEKVRKSEKTMGKRENH